MEWKLNLEKAGARPKYQHLVDFITQAVASGRLQPGDRIPSVADLVKKLRVNKVTVVRAFRELEQRGLIASQVGRGSFVTGAPAHGRQEREELRSSAVGASALTPSRPEVTQLVRRLRDRYVVEVMQLLAVEPRKPGIDLRAGIPPESGVPRDLLERVAQQVCQHNIERLYGYAYLGLPELRDSLATWLDSRGYHIKPEQILITNGSQQALSLLSAWALDDRRSIVCETPTFIGVPRLFAQTGHLIESVPWVGQELWTDKVTHLTKSRRCLIYCCPEFHNPTGQCLSIDSRLSLAELAVQSDTIVVVDDIFRDLRFTGEELPSLYEYLPPSRRILVGSFSKSLMPGLRVGFLVADRPLIEELAPIQRWMDLGGPPLMQAILACFLNHGYAEHLASIRAHYRERCEVICQALERHMPEGVVFTRPEGGFHLWVQMPVGFSSVQVYLQALERGVAIYPGSAHDIDGQYLHCFRLSYGCASPEEIQRGVEVVAQVVRDTLKRGPAEPAATGVGLPM
jgi:GntR family transcriptional regulator/MocR family aminotransferase